MCRVRKNIEGELYSMNYADAVAFNTDPIEKKPLYHFLPGTLSFSVAAAGCNLRCDFCQNWRISQHKPYECFKSISTTLYPEEIVERADMRGAESISYTYSEPAIFFEYAYETSKLAHQKGLKNIFVTNGFISLDAIEKISPYLDAANVDLKYFSEGLYADKSGGELRPVLDSIEKMKKLGVWIEITTLIIPGVNDSPDEFNKIASYIASLDKNIPWHISRFFPDYKCKYKKPTPYESMKKAAKSGKEAGLKYVYMGNVNKAAITCCPACSSELIQRAGFDITENRISEKGSCPDCGEIIKGVWA